MRKIKHYKGLLIPEHKGIESSIYQIECNVISPKCGNILCSACIFSCSNRQQFHEWRKSNETV